jgi:hypothetical protein
MQLLKSWELFFVQKGGPLNRILSPVPAQLFSLHRRQRFKHLRRNNLSSVAL